VLLAQDSELLLPLLGRPGAFAPPYIIVASLGAVVLAF